MWREGQLDVDFIVSSEVETAYAISRTIGVPSARQTDLFAEGQVQLVEFDVDERASTSVVGVPMREAKLPADSRVAAIIRGEEMRLPGGDDVIRPGDRIVVIGSPQSAQAWGESSPRARARCTTSSSTARDAQGLRSRGSCSSKASGPGVP